MANALRHIAALHGISSASVYYHMRRHGLRYRNKIWTKQDDNYLLFNAYHKSTKAMARTLGTSVVSVRFRMRQLCLTAQKCIGYTLQQFAHDCAYDHVYTAQDDDYTWLPLLLTYQAHAHRP
jgi:DNA-binding CsgD family transcriptional regulator